MDNVRRTALLVRNQADVWECVRSGLGLAIQDMMVGVFLVGCRIDTGGRDALFAENLEMINDLEGEVLTDQPENADRFPLIRCLPPEALFRSLGRYDLVVSF
jgi:hypothetical protein